MRNGDGDIVPRGVYMPNYDATLHIRPLRWGDAKALYNNREHSPSMLAQLFRLTVEGLNPDAGDIRAWPAGRAGSIERAVLKASGMLDRVDDSDDSDDSEDDDDPAEHSVMAGPEANERAQDALDEHTEADLIYQLHQQGYTFTDAARLLIPEIDTLMEGIDRANRRQEKQREESENNTQSGASGGMKGNAGGDRSDTLW